MSFYKLGLELFMGGGTFELIDWLVERRKAGLRRPQALRRARDPARSGRRLRERPIRFTTVHGNDGILEAACSEKGGLQVLAVTVLTSLDRGDLIPKGRSAASGHHPARNYETVPGVQREELERRFNRELIPRLDELDNLDQRRRELVGWVLEQTSGREVTFRREEFLRATRLDMLALGDRGRA